MNIDNIKSDHLMSLTHYVSVEHARPNALDVVDVDSGKSFRINGKELIKSMHSADIFSSTEKVSKTRAAELLTTAYGRPFTVAFEKQNGDTRVLRGRLIQPEPLMGRSMVEDLDQDGNKLRQIDHRTIKYIVIDDVKYEVKK